MWVWEQKGRITPEGEPLEGGIFDSGLFMDRESWSVICGVILYQKVRYKIYNTIIETVAYFRLSLYAYPFTVVMVMMEL